MSVHLLDIEWLLSTLFDASLFKLLSRRQRRLFFLPVLFRAIGGPAGRRAIS
jgi:hypothetical protein